MTFSLPGGPTATHYLERVRDGATTAPAHLDDAPGPAFVFDTPLERGVVGPVFAGTLQVGAARGYSSRERYLGKGDTGGTNTNTKSEGPAQVRVVAKVALHAAETALLVHEAAMYARAARLQGGVLPEVYGVFVSKGRMREQERRGSKAGAKWEAGQARAGGGFTVLVVGHRGAPVGELSALSWGQRVSLYISLALLHAHGVQHGDLRADNVVVSSDGLPSLIDLSHARAHACKGEGACAELRDGRVLFGLG
ncbi:hypothetical protein B0H14DRAFT_1210173 [Mycena olivaceomarginata]|nr:hypothetical protein B0H14DRAFT_1210173 [Mycena olivaceomarginata]